MSFVPPMLMLMNTVLSMTVTTTTAIDTEEGNENADD